MNVMECKKCVAVPGGDYIIDAINPITKKTWYGGETIDECIKKNKGAVVMKLDDYCAMKAKAQRTPVTWQEISEEQYYYYLEVLPPLDWYNGGFLVSEPSDHDAGNGQPRYQACQIARENTYLASSRPVTRAEFKQLRVFGIKTPEVSV